MENLNLKIITHNNICFPSDESDFNFTKFTLKKCCFFALEIKKIQAYISKNGLRPYIVKCGLLSTCKIVFVQLKIKKSNKHTECVCQKRFIMLNFWAPQAIFILQSQLFVRDHEFQTKQLKLKAKISKKCLRSIKNQLNGLHSKKECNFWEWRDLIPRMITIDKLNIQRFKCAEPNNSPTIFLLQLIDLHIFLAVTKKSFWSTNHGRERRSSERKSLSFRCVAA